jgi:hypothetical protein
VRPSSVLTLSSAMLRTEGPPCFRCHANQGPTNPAMSLSIGQDRVTPTGPADQIQPKYDHHAFIALRTGSQSPGSQCSLQRDPERPSRPNARPEPNPCPAFETQGATNLPQVSPTTCSTQAAVSQSQAVVELLPGASGSQSVSGVAKTSNRLVQKIA